MMASLALRVRSKAAIILGSALLAACTLLAQSVPPARTFHSSKADVEKALHAIPSYPEGKLPALEGFADPAGHALNDYKRGHYEYEVQLKSISASETSVQVNAKITAWYAANTTANSGYRVLKSGGRLEGDLLDALNEKRKAQGQPPIEVSTSPEGVINHAA